MTVQFQTVLASNLSIDRAKKPQKPRGLVPLGVMISPGLMNPTVTTVLRHLQLLMFSLMHKVLVLPQNC